MKTLKFFLVLVCVLTVTQNAFAAAESKEVSLSPVEVEIKSAPALADNKGTDISHIYVFTAENIKDGANKDQPYIVMFYLDGILLEGFRDQTLPVSIMKNFKGLREGQHEIRVDIEDNSNNGVVLSSQTTTINVEH